MDKVDVDISSVRADIKTVFEKYNIALCELTMLINEEGGEIEFKVFGRASL